MDEHAMTIPTTSSSHSHSHNSSDTMADSLRRNDEEHDGTTLDLDDLLEEENLNDLLDGIKRNTTIRTVQLEGDAIICRLDLYDAQRLMTALGGLPSLTKLFVHNFLVPLSLLTGLLQQAKTLEGITLHTAQLAGRTVQDATDFGQAVADLPCLQSIKWSNLVFAGSWTLEKLGQALSRVRSLQRVELELEQGGTMSTDVLEALLTRCPKLQELRLWRITLHPHHLILIAQIIEHNQTLQLLELGELGYAIHTMESYRAVANMLRVNTSLKTFGMINFSGLDSQGCTELAQALEHNETLREISVRGCDTLIINDDAALAVAQMFSRNTTLVEWCTNEVGISDQGAAIIGRALQLDNTTLRSLIFKKIVGNVPKAHCAFLEILSTNVALERIFPEATAGIKEQMDYLLDLNQAKLRLVQLGVDVDRCGFFNLIVSHRYNLNRIHYLLSSNPEFLHSYDD